jgi:hypothetical protein
MNYINTENIIAADMNDLREYSDNSCRTSYSFPTKMIAYYDTSLKIVDESNTILMEFVAHSGYILEDVNIKKIIFQNYRLIILTLNSIVVINFLTNSAYKIIDSGVYIFSGNISQRNTALGYISRYSANLFTGNLFDCINVDDNIIFSPYTGKVTIYDYSENAHFQEFSSSYEKCLLAYDMRYRRIWVIDNKKPQYGSFLFPITSDFTITMTSTTLTPYTINSLMVDSSFLYIGHNNGIIKINKVNETQIIYAEFGNYSTNVKSISNKMNNRIVAGTTEINGINGAFFSINKNDMKKKVILDKAILEGINYIETK